MKAPSKSKPKTQIFSGSLQCCYVSWKRDSFSRGGDPFQVSGKHQKRYAFPSQSNWESSEENSNGTGPNLAENSSLLGSALVSMSSSNVGEESNFDTP